MTDWPQIIEQYSALVWRIALRLLRNETDAADCAQRTFLSAWELSRKETIRHWPAILRKLATTRALEQLRQRKREDAKSNDQLESGKIELQHDTKIVTPESKVANIELAEHLREALTEIDPRQAEVFCLVCFEGVDYDEIAEQLNIKPTYARVLLSRAKDTLREKLKSHDPQVTSK